MGTTRRTALGAIATIAALMIVAPTGASAAGGWDHLLAPESTCPGQTDASRPPAEQAQVMVCLHAYARARSGLPSLSPLKKLRISAKRKARDITRCQQFSHHACGRDVFHWVERVGFLRGSSGAGENLAFGSGTAGVPRAIMTSWLDSDLHRSVLLTPSFRKIGIGMVRTNFQGYPGTQVWVAHFGYRR